ncbi:MAG: nuclear transport factor 2 family protein [Myxococcota bacterium]
MSDSADPRQNRAMIERFWRDLYARSFEAVGSYFAPEGLYEDVPTPDSGARGPRGVAARLRIGLEPLEKIEHQTHRMVAEGSCVVTEHTETWHFPTGEVVPLPFVSIHVIEGDKIVLWRDYWDLGTLMSKVPKWWLERLARASEADFA